MKKRYIFAITVAVMALSLAGCGSSDSIKNEIATSDYSTEATYDYGDDSAYDAGAEDEAVDSMTSSSASTSVGKISEASNTQSNEKIVTTYNYSLQTKTFDDFVAKVSGRVGQYGGYVENSSLTGSKEWQDRYLDITIRVPQENAVEFLEMVEDGATVTNMSTSTENVSLKYVDLQSHIETLRSEQDTLNRLLSEAVTVDEIISLTDRISNLRYEIESYESQLRVLANRVKYDTVKMQIKEVKEEAIVVPMSYGSELANGLIDTFTNIGEGFRGFSLWLIINLPYMLLFLLINGAIAGIIIAIVKGAIKSSKKREAKKAAKTPAQAIDVTDDMLFDPVTGEKIQK